MTRPRGRPREVHDAVRVSIRLSATDYDRLDALARKLGVSLPALIRRTVISASKNTGLAPSSAQ